jgi:hypothetical protein
VDFDKRERLLLQFGSFEGGYYAWLLAFSCSTLMCLAIRLYCNSHNNGPCSATKNYHSVTGSRIVGISVQLHSYVSYFIARLVILCFPVMVFAFDLLIYDQLYQLSRMLLVRLYYIYFPMSLSCILCSYNCIALFLSIHSSF